MSIYPERRSGRLTGRWIIEIESAGQRKRARADTYEAARIIEGQLVSGHVVTKAEKPCDLKWLSDHVNVIWGDSKDDQQAKRLDVCVRLIGPNTPLVDVTTTRLHKLKADLMVMPASRGSHRVIRDPKTLHRYLSAMSKALTWAKRQGKLTTTPDIPWPKVEDAPKRFFTGPEEDAVCRWLTDHDHRDHATLISVLSQTGLRVGELLRLRPENITDGYVLVGDYAGGTKTRDHRYVPISEALGASLTAILERGLPSYRSLLRALRRACEACGVDTRKTIHKLRHTTATRLMKAGVNAFVIKDYLGHKRLETTLGYASVEPSDLTEAAKAMRQQFPAGDMRGKVQTERRKTAANSLKTGGLARNRTGVQGFAEANAGTPIAASEPSRNTSEGEVDTSWIDLAEGRL